MSPRFLVAILLSLGAPPMVAAQDAKLVEAAKKEDGKVGQYLGLNQKAPRPNAGKAFIDFFLSAESMKLLAKAGEFVTLKGIPQLLPDADKIQAVEMDDLDNKGYAAKRDEYKKLFLK